MVIGMSKWEGMSVKELKAELKSRKITQNGNKKELIENSVRFDHWYNEFDSRCDSGCQDIFAGNIHQTNGRPIKPDHERIQRREWEKVKIPLDYTVVWREV